MIDPNDPRVRMMHEYMLMGLLAASTQRTPDASGLNPTYPEAVNYVNRILESASNAWSSLDPPQCSASGAERLEAAVRGVPMKFDKASFLAGVEEAAKVCEEAQYKWGTNANAVFCAAQVRNYGRLRFAAEDKK